MLIEIPVMIPNIINASILCKNKSPVKRQINVKRKPRLKLTPTLNVDVRRFGVSMYLRSV
jgi:hypothetical protein